MKNLPSLYQEKLQKLFSPQQYLLLSLVIWLLQQHRWVKLEKLAENCPLPILCRSRLKKLQRFLSLPQWTVEDLWLPIVKTWIKSTFTTQDPLYIVIDRSQWKRINLLMISVVYDKRAIPLSFTLLPQLGNTSASEQIFYLSRVLKEFKPYKKVVLGDREFCSVDLAKWLSHQEKTYFSLRLKKSTCLEVEADWWLPLQHLGLQPGKSEYHRGIKVTKSKGFGPIQIAAKWKRKYRDNESKEPWFLITNLSSLPEAITAYSQRMGIEEMFRDFKSGGYNLEDTQVQGQRLEALILLIILSYSLATFWGHGLKAKGVVSYVARPNEPKKKYRQHSSFYLGLQGFSWLHSLHYWANEVQELISYSPQSLPHYQRGMRAISRLQSVF